MCGSVYYVTVCARAQLDGVCSTVVGVRSSVLCNVERARSQGA
jgi:hypothetical protein